MPRTAASLPEITPRGLRLPQAHVYVGLGQSKFLALVEEGRLPKPAKLDGCTLRDRRALDQALDDLFEAQQAERDLPPQGKIIL